MDVYFFDTPGEERIARLLESDDEQDSDSSKIEDEVSQHGTSA